MQTHGTLLQVLEEDCDLHSRWWSVDSLGEPNSLVAAARTAVEAQLIIVAISDAGELSPAVTEWIDQWLPDKFDPDSGLVALIRKVSPRAETSVSIREHLRRVAKAAGMAFFVSERSWGDAVSTRDLTGPQGVHRGPQFSWEEHGGGHGIPRWGSNE